MQTVISFRGTKQELDRLCDLMEWERQETTNRRCGWNGTHVLEKGHKIGFIETASARKPCILEVVPRTGVAASDMIVRAFSAGDIEKLKGG